MSSNQSPQTEAAFHDTAAPLTAPPQAQLTPDPRLSVAPGVQPFMYAPGYGQPFQPYSGQPTMEPVPMPTNKAWEISKLVLHGLTIVFAVISLGLGLSLINEGQLALAVGVSPAVGVALIWSAAEIITRAVRKWKAGIHPGAHVGMSLIIWLSTAILGVVFGVFLALAELHDDNESCFSRYNQVTNRYSYTCTSDPVPSDIFGKAIAATVFAFLIVLIHFTLFIGACIDTHKRNRAAMRPIMIVAQPQHWPAMTQGWQPMPQNGGETQQQQTFPMQEVRAPAPQGKGKEPARTHNVVEHFAPGGSQA